MIRINTLEWTRRFSSMSLGPHETTFRSLLELAARRNNRLHNGQSLASARAQLEGEEEQLQINRMVDAAQWNLQHQQAISEVFLQNQLNNVHLDEFARRQESQYLQQFSRYGSSQPVMVYMPPTIVVQPPLPRALSVSQPTDIFDLTVDDEEEEAREEDERRRKEDDHNHVASPCSKSPTVSSENAARRRKWDEVSAKPDTMRGELPAAHDATIASLGTMLKPPQLALPSDYVPPKCVQSKDISVLAKVLLGQIDLAAVEENSFLKGPIILTPASLKVLAKRVKGQAKKDYAVSKNKKIVKMKSQLDAALKNSVFKEDVEQLKIACALEVEEVRRQSQLAMQAYMRATVNAFERLQPTSKDDNDE